MKGKVIVGIDIAGKAENPTGWALWKGKRVRTDLSYTDDELLNCILHNKPVMIAIDAPLVSQKQEC
ncbi:MAG: DUF429 domain-containing protein [Candidatus Bathyarchaeota archaeon]|nr:DUF429 domain-containing protein [Candidatus Bathyarchaeota archaeon]MDH5788310.1 DUF429 domain-containing protein [Candidatus Bathyarchaeota archaeon]